MCHNVIESKAINKEYVNGCNLLNTLGYSWRTGISGFIESTLNLLVRILQNKQSSNIHRLILGGSKTLEHIGTTTKAHELGLNSFRYFTQL